MPRRLRRPSHGTVAAYAALFIALGGTSYAAVKLPHDSVGSAQIKTHAVRGVDIASNAITTSKVKNGSLRAADFEAGALPPGPQGPAGPVGPPGPSSGVRGYGRVSQAGNITRSNGTVAVNRFGQGQYCLTPNASSGIDVSKTGIVVTIDESGVSTSPDQDQVVVWASSGSFQCPSTTSYLVNAYQNDTTNTTGGGDADPKFTHRLSDNAFFFMIP